MTVTPALAVLMAVKNGADCVSKAVESVLGQSFRDFEFVVVNDGNSDPHAYRLASCSDRIVSKWWVCGNKSMAVRSTSR